MTKPLFIAGAAALGYLAGRGRGSARGRRAANPFPGLKRYFPGQRIQAAFPGPYNPEARDVQASSFSLAHWAWSFGDANGWWKYSDIAIIAGEDGESLDMVYRKNADRPNAKEGWYWCCNVDLEPWRFDDTHEFPILRHRPLRGGGSAAPRGRRCCGDKREKELLAEIKTLKKSKVKRR